MRPLDDDSRRQRPSRLNQRPRILGLSEQLTKNL